MKVLLIKPMEHPQVVDIENSLKEFYRILDCDCITATYPWEERAAPGPHPEIQGSLLGAGGIRQHVRADGSHPDG